MSARASPPQPDDPRRERLGPLLARWTTWRLWLDRPDRTPAEPQSDAPPLSELLAWYLAQRIPIVRTDRPRPGPWLRAGRLLAALLSPPLVAVRLLVGWLWRRAARRVRR